MHIYCRSAIHCRVKDEAMKKDENEKNVLLFRLVKQITILYILLYKKDVTI